MKVPARRNRRKKVYQPNALINRKVCTWRGNITTLEIDAVVNAANESMLGGGGIDGAIHGAAGRELYYECKTLNGAHTGETKITRGHNLPAKYILHTVGPRGERPEALRSCYRSILELAVKHGLRTVAFCGVSTGIFGYPLENASRVALEVVREWCEVPGNLDKIDLLIFCTFLEREEQCYERLMFEYFPPTPDPAFQAIVDDFLAIESSEESESSSEEEEEEDSDDERVSAFGGAPSALTTDSDEEEDEDEEKQKVPDVIFGAAQLVEGEVEIEIPPTGFDSVYEDFYYSLTPVGSYAQLFVKSELEDGNFVVATADGNKNATFHWQIRGEVW
eukprot:TRINITY_DN39_c0_g1_i2.p1 TRINITY_DN39_c0_g1~~TRINITY_DN39_c0_g1_i2.p1  ORF type:complete len:334 (-),score=92.57 TRINITY_DN39_c0_g1_i2:58-1059(-)